MYKLFVGFKKLGEFDSILIAKQRRPREWNNRCIQLIGDKRLPGKK